MSEELDMKALIDYKSKTGTIKAIIKNVTSYIKDKHQEEINLLIDDHRTLRNKPTEVTVSFRGREFSHSKWLAVRQPPGKPRRIPVLHLDLFDRGTAIYLKQQKLDQEELMMQQMLSILTAHARTLQDFRDALPHSVDQYALPISQFPRTKEDFMYAVTEETQRNQLEEMVRMFSIYSMAELMGK